MIDSGGSQRVAELMRETAAAELLPRFRNLSKEEVRQKRPGDIVTVADVASEQRLANGLAKILPGVPVVGEEAVEKDPGLLDLVARPGEACWIVDPLDGTANFAAGRDRFAMIICRPGITIGRRSPAGSSTCRTTGWRSRPIGAAARPSTASADPGQGAWHPAAQRLRGLQDRQIPRRAAQPRATHPARQHHHLALRRRRVS
jgi:3'-phosphoadenosine 5'-phosphosulfate (PAPS) 3'-phosphatase